MGGRKFRAWFEPPYCSEDEPCIWMAKDGTGKCLYKFTCKLQVSKQERERLLSLIFVDEIS